MRTLRVADLEAKPGEKVSGFVHIIGADFGIPVTLICGEQKGETVLISVFRQPCSWLTIWIRRRLREIS